MTKAKWDYDNAKNNFSGKAKEVAGKITCNEQLELKGKIQSSKAKLKKNANVGNKIEEIKEVIAGKLNDKIDKSRSKSKEEK
jgi:uncharacterized protein YjbJ (UPF0337 family)